MKETEGIIERVRRINPAYQQLELAVDESLMRIKPGQSLMVRCGEGWSPYLREQWWPVGLAEGRLLVERSAAESYQPGQVVNLLGLVGQPFRFRRTLRNVLLMAYDAPPTPLLMTIPWLLSNNISVTVVLLGSALDYTTHHLPPEVEVVQGEADINWPNQVMTVGWADQVFVVVAPDDENLRFARVLDTFRQRRADVPQNYLFGVFQPVVACGAGACQVCMVRTLDGTRLSCTEGPAFDLTKVVLS